MGLTSTLLFLTALAAPRTAPAAIPIVVDVWPGKTPGDTGIKGEETSRVFVSPIVGPTKIVSNISKPTILVYPPPRNKNNGTAMIILPGGGYWDLLVEIEGEEVAAWLNVHGMTGIILKYRVPRRAGDARGVAPPGPLLDAQRAVSLVRSRAKEWGINPNRIGMIGFSAGGHLAFATATSFEKRTYDPIDAVDQISCRPDFAVMCYPGYLKEKETDQFASGLHIPANTPPMLLAHANDDSSKRGGSDPENSAIAYLALKRAGAPAELHIFASGDHDFGVRENDKLTASWTRLLVNWLRSFNLLTPAPAAARR